MYSIVILGCLLNKTLTVSCLIFKAKNSECGVHLDFNHFIKRDSKNAATALPSTKNKLAKYYVIRSTALAVKCTSLSVNTEAVNKKWKSWISDNRMLSAGM